LTPPSFSLTGGGPLHRLLDRLDLSPLERPGLARLVPLCIAITWLPLLAIAVIGQLTTGRMPVEFADFGVHARLLLAVPLFFYAERALHLRTRRCIGRLLEDQWAEDGAQAVAQVTDRAARWRNATAPELLCLLLALLGSQVVMSGLGEQLGIIRDREGSAGGPGTLWYRLVGLPLFQFLLYRWIWRWMIWVSVLRGLSRLSLRPLATHPDRRGGLAFLAEPSVAFAVVICGLSAVQAGIWADEVMFGGAELISFAPPLVVTLLAYEAAALGPLLYFVVPLWRAQFADVREYDLLGTELARQFHQKRVVEGQREGLLGGADVSSLADFNVVRDVVRKMVPIPLGLPELAGIAAAVVVPMLPLPLLNMPLLELLERLGKVLLDLPG
jgi:hypothetical protein